MIDQLTSLHHPPWPTLRRKDRYQRKLKYYWVDDVSIRGEFEKTEQEELEEETHLGEGTVSSVTFGLRDRRVDSLMLAVEDQPYSSDDDDDDDDDDDESEGETNRNKGKKTGKGKSTKADAIVPEDLIAQYTMRSVKLFPIFLQAWTQTSSIHSCRNLTMWTLFWTRSWKNSRNLGLCAIGWKAPAMPTPESWGPYFS